MAFRIMFHEDVEKDIKKLKLNKTQLIKLRNKIEKISLNPYPKAVGGLGEKLKGDLKGFLRFRFDNDYRVVYRIEEVNEVMTIIIIGLRKDKQIYKDLTKRF